MNQNHIYPLPNTNRFVSLFVFISLVFVLLLVLVFSSSIPFFGDSLIPFFLCASFIVGSWIYSESHPPSIGTLQVTTEAIVIKNKKDVTLHTFQRDEVNSILIGHVVPRDEIFLRKFVPVKVTFVVQNKDTAFWLAWKDVIALQESLLFLQYSGIDNFAQMSKLRHSDDKQNSFEKNFVFIFGGIMFCLVLALSYWAGTQIK